MMQQINKPYDGLFVTIEGGEGCGKTTLSRALVLELEKRGYSVFKTREPGGTPLSEHIRQLLLSPKKEFSICDKAELLLFLAARAQHFEESIRPALYQGKIVICERYNDSTIAYQGCARHLGMKYVEQLCKQVSEDPDFTLFLDLEPQEAMHRLTDRSFDRLEQEHLQFHKEVRQGFLHLADEYPKRIAILDASLPIDEVIKAALKAIEPRLMIRKA